MKELEYPFDNAYVLKNKKRLKRDLMDNGNFIEKKIAILSGSTVGELQNILELFLLNNGIKPIFWQGDYNRFYEDAIFLNSDLKNFAPDIIYIHTTVKNINLLPDVNDNINEVRKKLDKMYDKYKRIWEGINKHYNCLIIQNNFEALSYRIMGNSDVYQSAGGLNFINHLNDKLYQYVREHKYIYINDLNYQASSYGLENWFDHSLWYLYKYPFAVDAIPLVSFNISNIIKSIYGMNKKAVVLDLDNTLWGGVIGDDGLYNLKIGSETPEGMAFSQFQYYLKQILNLGISLNICSKNEEEIAKVGFDHESSILTVNDFTCFKANWMNKDINIQEIIKTLNIMNDSVVFLDDNPVEQQYVRSMLSQVTVPELDSPEKYVDILDKSGYFEVTFLSEDDKNRNQYFNENKKRHESESQFLDYKEYLKSLEMVCTVKDFNETYLERIVQLINKTNQFNLTTIRYTVDEIIKYIERKDAITVYASLKDKYGDNGIVTCLMGEFQKDTLDICLWVMSCRVFKRDLELAMFDVIVKKCIDNNIKYIKGFYYITKKNKFVKNLYGILGFKLIEKNNDGDIWLYDIPVNYQAKNKCMEVLIDE